MKAFPTPTRPREYVAFFKIQITTGEGPAHIFMAVDAFTKYLFNLEVEPDEKPETVLKKVYYLLEDPTFTQFPENEFTFVIGDYEELTDRINMILSPAKGKVLFDPVFNDHITAPVLESMREWLSKEQ